MKTNHKFSNDMLLSVYRILRKKVGEKSNAIPFEDIAKEIEIVYFQNPNEELFTLVTLCRRAMRSLLYQYGYSPDYGKDKVNFNASSMSKTELNCYAVLDEKFRYMSCSEILRYYSIVPRSNYVNTLSNMLKFQVTDKENEEQRKKAIEKNRFSEKMVKADYCTAARILKKLVSNPEANPFTAIEKLPKERAERICNFLQKKYQLKMA